MKILCLNGGSSSLKFAVYTVEGASETPVCVMAEDLAASQSADSQLQHVPGNINERAGCRRSSLLRSLAVSRCALLDGTQSPRR
jgi:acetate kinase